MHNKSAGAMFPMQSDHPLLPEVPRRRDLYGAVAYSGIGGGVAVARVGGGRSAVHSAISYRDRWQLLSVGFVDHHAASA